jgi:glycosyltransferase involved in cell wall biosynthesis
VSRSPEIALLVSSYQRPQHLSRALLSIAMQRRVAGRMEVVVTDDGSTDDTPQVVHDFARSVDFPVRFTTHPHAGFQLCRCRN